MPPKRGEGVAAKSLKALSGEAWAIFSRMVSLGPLAFADEQERRNAVAIVQTAGAMAQQLHKDLAALESASSPSALIAAVEAMIQYQKMTITMWDTGGKYILANRAKYTLQDMNGVLNLLRSPPTEEVA